jgi:hypothetical protein
VYLYVSYGSGKNEQLLFKIVIVRNSLFPYATLTTCVCNPDTDGNNFSFYLSIKHKTEAVITQSSMD